MAEKMGAGNKPQNYDEKTGEYADTDFFKEAEKAVTLSKQEWARYYEKIGEIKAGLLLPRITANGYRVIALDNKVIFDNGKYANPKVYSIKEFKSVDYLNDFLDELEQAGFLKWQ